MAYNPYVLHCPGTTLELTLRFKNAHFFPTLPQSANADGRRVGCASNVFDIQQLVLATECKEVGEERVEVRLRAKMENLGIVCMIYMSEDA